jgi:regulator of sigma E protease
VNILIAFVLFWAVLYSGSLNGAIALGNLDEHIETIVPSTSISGVGSKTPAAHGLRAGDRIVSVDGIPATIEGARAQVNTHRCAGKQTLGCTSATPVHLVVLRDGQRVAVSLYPRYEETLDRHGHPVKRMLLGFSFGSPKSFGAIGAAGASAAVMWNTTTSTLTHFADALTSSKTRGELHSIVGISEVGQETVAAGAGYALVFLGFLSLVLAVINLFPFLPLDGGHVLWSVAEKVRGRRISLLAMYRFSSVGILLMLFLVINGVGNDISRLAG